MNKPTTGPWFVTYGEKGSTYVASKANMGYQAIAKMHSKGRNLSADARLISAAPNLLEAAKMVFTEFCEADPESESARALAHAIAMAEGGE